MNSVATRILELYNQRLIEYLGDYDYYVEKKTQMTGSVTDPLQGSGIIKGAAKGDSGSVSQDTTVASSGAVDYKAQKEQNALRRKNENELKKCEERIAHLESENKKLEEKMADPSIATSSVKLQEITSSIETNNSELETLYSRWEELETILNS